MTWLKEISSGGFIHGAISLVFPLVLAWMGYSLLAAFVATWLAGFWGGREAGQHDDTPFSITQIWEWSPSQLIAIGFIINALR